MSHINVAQIFQIKLFLQTDLNQAANQNPSVCSFHLFFPSDNVNKPSSKKRACRLYSLKRFTVNGPESGSGILDSNSLPSVQKQPGSVHTCVVLIGDDPT